MSVMDCRRCHLIWAGEIVQASHPSSQQSAPDHASGLLVADSLPNQKPSPTAHQAANAVHSIHEKEPGTSGTAFISTIAAPTTAPSTASHISARARRPRRRKATQAEHQPTPTAMEPTSEMGTSTASPRGEATAVIPARSRIAALGVPNRGCTPPRDGCTKPRRPIAKRSREAATKLPLYTLKSDRNAPSRMNCAMAREPNARSNAVSVPTLPATTSRQG